MDRIDKKTRSHVMSKVRSKETKLEQIFFAILDKGNCGDFVSYEANLPGTPDVVFRKKHVVVFLDSCFWHGCPKHLRRPASNTDYWTRKVANNIKRDRRQRALLRKLGWSVLRVWEHDLGNAAKITKKIHRALNSN